MPDLFEEIQKMQLHEASHEDTLYGRPVYFVGAKITFLTTLYCTDIYLNVPCIFLRSLYSKRVFLEICFGSECIRFGFGIEIKETPCIFDY